ncbi:MAG TPA: substrate-binding domain-containing protein, partial [Mobilitalea sp.]|nr:substrate-binding domain-containing protein [Mobilitalea sp.]
MVISLAFLLFIMWHRNSIEHSTQAASKNMKNYKVYLITAEKGYEYWQTVNQGAADMAAIAGVNYTWLAPAVRSTEEQIKLINQAIDSGANALIIAADDPKRVSYVIEDAKAKSIKIIYVDQPAYEEALVTLATDNYAAGVEAGKAMISNLNDMKITSGSIGIVNLTHKENTALREQGFRDTFAQDGRFTVLDTMFTELDTPEESQAAAQRLIDENKDLVALFGTSEGTTMGVGFANRANNNRYIAVGYDKTEVNTQLLRGGSLKAIIDQNPYTMGYLGMAEAIAAILGKSTGPRYINTGVTVVDINSLY